MVRMKDEPREVETTEEAGIRRILPVERALREERPQGEGTPERVQP